MQPLSMRAQLEIELVARYGVARDAVRVVWVPYRVCPLGAHIDHQLGRVTAMAIDRGVSLAFARSGSREVRLSSLAYPGEARFRIDDVPPMQPGDWGNYARGAVLALSRLTPLSQGIVGVTSGDLAEVGLSSSASIGVAYLLALEAANGLSRTPAENVRLDQAIENEYLGLNNGILDQAALLFSRREHLTAIDCRAFVEGPAPAQAIQTIPMNGRMPPWAILIAFSGLIRPLAGTDYNRRVSECADAARVLLDAAGRPSAPARLGWVSPSEYDAHRARLTGPPAKRAEHFFGELQRVERGLEAWRQGDVVTLGRLMTESGRSSIENYQCGSPPLIDLYEILLRMPGVLGARFSGAGFRGCCVALVEPSVVEGLLPEIRQAYAARQPELAARAHCVVCQSSDAAQLL
jgi:galacturonokinase